MDTLLSFLSQTFPGSKSHFHVDDIPDLSGKVAIVTGGNTGVGKETVKALLSHNARVYVATRNEEKSVAAIADLKATTGHEAYFLKLDLADLNSVKEASEIFMQKEQELHMLFNNAGVMEPDHDELTAQGYDLQFGVNVLGHFYFTKLLLPLLIKTSKANPEFKARVVTTSSSVSMFHGIEFNTLKDGSARQRKSTHQLYSQSKNGNVVFANELARRYEDEGVISSSCNPGNLKTELQRNVPRIQRAIITLIFLFPVSFGALSQLYAGTTKDGLSFSGKYLVPWARVGNPPTNTMDPAIGKKLWEWLEEQVISIN